MVFDAHDKALVFFEGVCRRGIYDNMKTAAETIFVSRERQYNHRIRLMCAHHFVDPVACTPASGWEKGQVENQVGVVRERFFTPRVRVKSGNPYRHEECRSATRSRPGNSTAHPVAMVAMRHADPARVGHVPAVSYGARRRATRAGCISPGRRR